MLPPLVIVPLPEPPRDNPNIFRLDEAFPDRNYLVLADNVDYMMSLPTDSIDMGLTSPAYGNIAEMGGMYDFDLVAQQLYRIMKPHQALVWVEGDERVDNFRSGCTAEHICKFRAIGFGLHDEMIMVRSHTKSPSNYCHANVYEHALILSKGKIRPPNILRDVPNLTAGTNRKPSWESSVAHWQVQELGRRTNCWYIKVGGTQTSADPDVDTHPTKMVELMAEGHILTWSYPGETVLDCFSGSGTTAKMALLNDRNFIGIECDEEWHTIACQRLQDTQQELEKSKRLEAGDRGIQ